ncbi:MAG: flagellar assembly protein FliX [Rickettsiales bacterium]|jgi:hypothetical protein
MKIDAYGNIRANSATKKKSGVSSTGGFLNLLETAEAEESSPTGKNSNISATSSLSGMLAFQEVSDEDIRRKKLIKQGGEILDSLEQLRRRLLIGTLPIQTLRDISQQLSLQRQEVADPQLIAIMDEIELRAAVELAKLEMAIETKKIHPIP